MAKKRGFLAEYQRQVRLAEQRQRQRAQQAARAERARQAELRRVEQEQRAAERAEIAAARLSEKEQKQREREALADHQAAMQAEVDDLNATLEEARAELDGILTSTLEIDDYVDLESLRVQAQHPPFPHEHLRTPTPPPSHVEDPPRPEFREPAPPFGLFNRKKRQEEAEAAAHEQYRLALQQWEAHLEELSRWRIEAEATHQQLELDRQRDLTQALETYQRECENREQEAAARNKDLDDLIIGLGYGTQDAINEYIGIVLANSVYPESVTVEHSATFNPSDAELILQVNIPAPDTFPVTKSYKYVKSTDEITTTTMSQKDQKDRYSALVHSVALRTLHEVFEADRRELIRSIALELGTFTLSPATGQPAFITLLGVATSRETFSQLDLAAVVPAATLQHLGAVISKNPLALVPADLTGVRRG